MNPAYFNTLAVDDQMYNKLCLRQNWSGLKKSSAIWKTGGMESVYHFMFAIFKNLGERKMMQEKLDCF